MEEYGILGVSLVAVAVFARWLVQQWMAASDRREARLTAELAESRKQFIAHLENGNAAQVEAQLAVAKQLELLNTAQKEHDDNAQKRHDASMKVMQEMAQQQAWRREQHEGVR